MSSENKNIIVAIDGYSSSGKSTMARRLAAAVGYRYIDSGAMYRAVTLSAMEHGLVAPGKEPDVAAVTALLPGLHIDFRPNPDGSQTTMLNGRDVERLIRSLEVSDCVSPVAAIPEVRHALTAMQRRLGEGGGIVMDGRDIGTTVFPNAGLKIFVNASAEERARRRWLELKQKGQEAAYEDVLANVQKRDHIDETRQESPLRRAADAILFDNSALTLDEQDAAVMDMFRSALAR